MKQSTRFITVVILMLFAFNSIQAQNAERTRAQTRGLLSNDNFLSVVDKTLYRISGDLLLEEGFDTDWLPSGWTVINTHQSENWMQSNPANENFDKIDPTSLFSALVPWIGDSQDEWLLTPEINAMGETPLNIIWYAGVSGPWLTNATLRLMITSDDGATWEELWNAIGTINPAADWAWNMVVTNLDAYADGIFKLAWNYKGSDGDLAAIDGVKLGIGTFGINENGQSENVRIYPNPVADVVNIESEGNIEHLRVMNSVGQFVYDQEINITKTQINTSNFQEGVYFVIIHTNNGSTTQKIVIE